MITINNYFSTSQFDFSILKDALRKGHEFLVKVTQSGENWSMYHSSISIKKMVDTYLEKLNQFIQTRERKQVSPKSGKVRPVKHERPAKSRSEIQREPSEHSEGPILVERVPEELRFIRRFVNLNGKSKTKEDILRFINSLQKAIVEKRIRKTSAYAEQIGFIQTRLIETYRTMKTKIKLELKPETLEALKHLASSEKVLPSTSFIKRYISMNGKPGMKEKAKQLLTQINRAIEKGKITDSDPYTVEMYEIKKSLKLFTTNAKQKTLEIEPATLHGLEGILGCACESLNGLETKPTIMNSVDFVKMQFSTIGLKGKWLDFIGDPSRNFTAMVFGKPKMGKSILCIEFAGYLARNHGKVLYVAKEEGLDYTLQEKLNESGIQHPNLDVASVLPGDLSAYDFIFIDSVTKLGLQPEDLTRLKALYPHKSFIYIFQSTKQGKFRGANAFQHDVDVVIEVPEKGKAIQMGRFNQGGEMDIFEQLPQAA